MADDIDRANDLAQMQIESALHHQRAFGSDRTGDKPCNRCGQKDWRTREGFAVCDDCMLDMSGEAS